MKAFNNGDIVEQNSVRIHLNSVTSAMGTLIFEALRCYKKDGADGELYAFRSLDHYRRLQASLRCLNMEPPVSYDEFKSAISRVIVANGISDNCYLKVIVYWDQILAGTSLFDLSEMSPKIAVLVKTTSEEFFSNCQSLRCCVSSWRRINEEALPVTAKASANYFNARLGLIDALRNGYHNAIFLDHVGRVSEAAEANVFLVRWSDHTVVTPSLDSSILPGITRDTIMHLVRNSSQFRLEERSVNRAELYSADEIFLVNTAQLVRQISEIDGRTSACSGASDVLRIREGLLDILFQRTPQNEEWFCRVA